MGVIASWSLKRRYARMKAVYSTLATVNNQRCAFYRAHKNQLDNNANMAKANGKCRYFPMTGSAFPAPIIKFSRRL